MRKSPALSLSFRFTEKQTNKNLGTKPMHLFYTGKKQRIHPLLILDTNNFMESLRDSFEAAWCPKGCESPKEKGQGEKDGIFSNHLMPAALLLSLLSLSYGTSHGLTENIQLQRS